MPKLIKVTPIAGDVLWLNPVQIVAIQEVKGEGSNVTRVLLPGRDELKISASADGFAEEVDRALSG